MKDALSDICRPELIVSPSEYYLANFYYVPDLPSGNIEKMNNPEDLFGALETLVSSMQDNYLNNNILERQTTTVNTNTLPLEQNNTTTSTTVISSKTTTKTFIKTEDTVTETNESEEQSKEEEIFKENEEEEEKKKEENEAESDYLNDKSIENTPVQPPALTSSPIPKDTSLLNDTINSDINNNELDLTSSSTNQLIPTLSSDLILLSQLLEKLHEVFINQTSNPTTAAPSVPSITSNDIIMDNKSFASSSTTTSISGNINNTIIPNNNRFQPHFYHTYHEQKELHGELIEYKKKLEESNSRIKQLSDTVVDMSQRLSKTKQKEAEGKMHLNKLIETYNLLSVEIDGLSPPFTEISNTFDHTKKDLEELRNNTEKIFDLEKKYRDILGKYNDMNSKYKELNDRYNLQRQLYQTIKGQLQCIYYYYYFIYLLIILLYRCISSSSTNPLHARTISITIR